MEGILYKKAHKVAKFQNSNIIGTGGTGTGITGTGDPMQGIFNEGDFKSFNNAFGNKKKKKKKDDTELSIGPSILNSDTAKNGIGTGVNVDDMNAQTSSSSTKQNDVFESLDVFKNGDKDSGDKKKKKGDSGDFSIGENSWGDGNLGKNIDAYAAVGSLASGALSGLGDDGDDNYTNGEATADIGAGVLSGAAAGAPFGPVGLFAGAAISGTMAAINVRKRRKEIRANAWKGERIEDTRVSSNKKMSIANKSVNSMNSAEQMYGTRVGGTGGGYAFSRRGGKFMFPKYTLNLSDTKEFDTKIHLGDRAIKPVFRRGGAIKIFKKGGKVKTTENIIPNGVLHEEKNSLGDKGMPVVKCTKDSCTKHYEIEKDEMILTLEATKQAEKLAKGSNFKALGAFVRDQIIDNTHSYTEKFKHLNNDETIFAKDRR